MTVDYWEPAYPVEGAISLSYVLTQAHTQIMDNVHIVHYMQMQQNCLFVVDVVMPINLIIHLPHAGSKIFDGKE